MITNDIQHTTPRKTYYLKNRVFFLISACVFSALGIWVLLSRQRIIEFLFLLLINILMVISVYQTRIVISPRGISYHKSGLYSIHSNWQDIEKIGSIKLHVPGEQRCLIVKKHKKLGWWTDLASTIPRQERGRVIPIPNDGNWDHFDDLKDQIKRYNPDVEGLD